MAATPRSALGEDEVSWQGTQDMDDTRRRPKVKTGKWNRGVRAGTGKCGRRLGIESRKVKCRAEQGGEFREYAESGFVDLDWIVRSKSSYLFQWVYDPPAILRRSFGRALPRHNSGQTRDPLLYSFVLLTYLQSHIHHPLKFEFLLSSSCSTCPLHCTATVCAEEAEEGREK